MDKKFESEVNKIEKLLDKVDNDLLRQGLKSDFTVFFKNMDKTFEIYNVCLEELCGQFYLMDLAFHSRVVRKLFHNYKHQLHNIMKYQLTLQKELNLKYQQEKTLKQQVQKLEEDLKNAQKVAEEPKKVVPGLNFSDDDEIREKKLAELKKQHDKMKADMDKDDQADSKLMSDMKEFLSKDFKTEDTAKLRENLMLMLSQLEKEREKYKAFADPNSEAFKTAMRLGRKEVGDGNKLSAAKQDQYTMVRTCSDHRQMPAY